MRSKIYLAVFFVSVFLSQKYYGQWSYNLSTEQEFNDNPFRSTEQTSTFINNMNLNVAKELNNFAFGYQGSYFNFTAIPERNFYWHVLSASVNFENSNAGIFAEQRLGKDIYTYYDYTNYTAYYNHQFSLNDIYFSVSPNFSLTKYSNIPILNNLKFAINGSINHGFETGTTLILGSGFTFKKYLNPVQSGTFSYLDETNQVVTECYIDKNISSLTQIHSFLRIAQSVTSTTGIAFQFTNRSILSGIASYAKDLNLVYGDESEIFDDPVNYKGNNYSLELTQLLFENTTVKAGFFLNNKFYPSQGIYDELYNYYTDAARIDNQKIFNIGISHGIQLGGSGQTTLDVNLKYQLIDNSSNSSPFNYKNNSISLSLGIEF